MMHVIVNCKTKQIDYSNPDFRQSFKRRFDAEKSFRATYSSNPSDASITVTKEDDGEQFIFDKEHTEKIAFFLDNKRPYAEIVVDGKYTYSFVLAPEEGNSVMDVDGVFEFRESFDALAEAAGIEVDEHIDPNNIGLTPDGVDSLDELLEMRSDDGIRYDADLNYIPTHDFINDEDTLQAHEDIIEDSAAVDELDVELPEDVDEFVDEEFAADDVTEDIIELQSLDDEEISNAIDEYNEDTNEYIEHSDEANSEYHDADVPSNESVDELFDGNDNDVLSFATVDDTTIDNVTVSYEPIDFSDIDGFDDESVDNYDASMDGSEIDPISVLANGSTILGQMKEQLEQEKQRRLAEIERLAAEARDDAAVDDDDVVVPDESESIARVDKLVEDNKAAASNGSASMSALETQRDKLEEFGEQFSEQMDAYGDLIESNKQDDEDFIASVENGEGGDASTYARLIDMIRDQTRQNDVLNETLKREQDIKKKYIEQLADAQSTIAGQQARLEEVKRRIAFSREQQQSNERFVNDAKESVRRTLREANVKIQDAFNKTEDMRKQMEESEAEAKRANDEARKAREDQSVAEQLAASYADKLESERAYSKSLLDSFQEQMDAFADDSTAKIEAQVTRADEAEAKYAECSKLVSTLESDLANSKTQVMMLGNQIRNKNSELDDMRKRNASTEEELSDMSLKYEMQARKLEDTEGKLGRTESALEDALEANEKLSSEAKIARDDRDQAIADKVRLVGEAQKLKDDAVNEARTERDEKIAAAEAERDEKIAAAEKDRDESIEAIKTKMTARANAAEESRAKAMDACQKVIDELSGIINNGMSSGFGNRKKKLDAIESALSTYLSEYESANELGEN